MERTGALITFLVVVVVILGGIVLYALVIKPTVNGYVTNGQNQGIQYTVLSIMQQAASCQTVPLTYGNQTITLVAVECLQQPGQTAQTTNTATQTSTPTQ